MDTKTNNLFKNISFCFINPPILDYALYDLFALPLGTLKTIKLLNYLGADIFYLDALDKNFDSSFFEKSAIKPTIKQNGTGKYWKKKVKPPEFLSFFPREFYRFGLDFAKIIEILKQNRNFDFIIITSVFTYHYLSLKILVEKIKENFPFSKTILAGIYPKLLNDHANKLGFDYVFDGSPFEFINFISKIISLNINSLEYFENSNFIYQNQDNKEIIPEWKFVQNLKYGIIRTTSGCPFSCPYCASNILSGKFRLLPLDYSFSQLKYFSKNKIHNIAFYDDALLINEKHFFDFIEKAEQIDKNFSFYLPNAIHIAKATKEVLNKMVNFKMIRFGLESIKIDDEKYGSKFTLTQLKKLISNLNETRISKEYISFYILVGLPDQSYEEVEYTIKMALSLGIKPRIAEFSPIPKTPLFYKAKEDIIKNKRDYINLEEPLFQNPSIYPYVATEFTLENMKKLKNLIYN